MEDFGDFVGQQGQQITSQFLTQLMMEARMSRRMSNGLEKAVGESNRDAEMLKDKLDGGSVKSVETQNFDLSAYSAEDRQIILGALKSSLAENGFDPEGLVPIGDVENLQQVKTFEFAADRGGSSIEELCGALGDAGIPYSSELGRDGAVTIGVKQQYVPTVAKVIEDFASGRPGVSLSQFSFPGDFQPSAIRAEEATLWCYTYAKEQARAMYEVLSSYLPKAFIDYGLANKLGIDEQCFYACGFGALDRQGRNEFYEGITRLFQEHGIDQKTISVSLNASRELAGDLSVPYQYKKLLEDYCAQFNELHGTKISVLYDLNPAGKYGSYDECYSLSEELSQAMLKNGIDHQITNTQNGSMLITIDPDEAPNMRDFIEWFDAEKSEQIYRQSLSKARVEGRMQSAECKIAHAKEAEAALRKAQERGLDHAKEWIARHVVEASVKPPVI